MWKSIAKKASFAKKPSVASLSAKGSSSSMTSSTGDDGGDGGDDPSSTRKQQEKLQAALEKKGSAALGPFSFDEFGQLQLLFK